MSVHRDWDMRRFDSHHRHPTVRVFLARFEWPIALDVRAQQLNDAIIAPDIKSTRNDGVWRKHGPVTADPGLWLSTPCRRLMLLRRLSTGGRPSRMTRRVNVAAQQVVSFAQASSSLGVGRDAFPFVDSMYLEISSRH
jgi:hypothetical protein